MILNNKLLSSVSFLAFIVATNASAQPIYGNNSQQNERANVGNVYVSISAEIFQPQDTDVTAFGEKGTIQFGTGYGVDVATGYAFPTNNFRVEGEFGYKNIETKSIKSTLGNFDFKETIDIYDLAVNGYYDIDLDFAVKPYIGAGIGVAMSPDGDGSALFYQGMVGASYDIDEVNTVFAGYKYSVIASAIDQQGVKSDDFQSHGGEVGYLRRF